MVGQNAKINLFYFLPSTKRQLTLKELKAGDFFQFIHQDRRFLEQKNPKVFLRYNRHK